MDPASSPNPQPPPPQTPVSNPEQQHPAEPAVPTINWQHGAGLVAEIPGSDVAIPISGDGRPTPPSASTTPRYSDWQQPSEWTARGLPSTPVTSPNVVAPSKSKAPKVLAIIAIILAILVAALITYLLFKKESKPAETAKKSTAATVATAHDISVLNHATLNAPARVGDLTLKPGGTDNVQEYTSSECGFIAATVSAAELSGTDIYSIVNARLTEFKKTVSYVSPLEPGVALILKEASGTGMYVMPTVNYEFSQGNKYGIAHVSVAILASGDRVMISRICGNANGHVDPAKLTVLDDIAKDVTVTVKD